MARLDTFSDTERNALSELKASLSAMLGDKLVAVRLFGSRARGDSGLGSDIDIAVIVHDLTTKLKHAILDRVAEIEFSHVTPLSVVVFSEKVFNDLKNRERRIALDIDAEGIAL